MKQLFMVLISCGMLFVVEQAFGMKYATYEEAGTLTPQEAATLAYLWEEQKHLRDIFLAGSECSDDPEMVSAAVAEQEHMDLLKGLLHHYGLEVPVPSEEVGVFTDSFEIMPWTGWSYSCVRPDTGAFVMATIYEERLIWNLLQAIEQTDKQRLLDAYNFLLAEACDHLRLFVSLYDWDDWEAAFLSQDLFDQILAGTFPAPSSEGFAINAGLNDAWYYPETDGQGFFISVFPNLGTVSLAWFTFDTVVPDEYASANLGDSGQRWLIANGKYEGSQATLTVRSVSGGLFDTSPPEPVLDVIGSIVLQFEDCNKGSVIYDLPTISKSGVIPIERVATDNVAVCEAYEQSGQSMQ